MRRPLLFLFCFCCLRATAQLPSPFRVTLYNEANGINKGRVTCLLQARNGYLWLGTTNGLLRFDGYGFKQFTDTALSNTVTFLAEDSSGALWMSLLGGGLLRYEPRPGRFTRYTVSLPGDASVANAETSLIYFDSQNQLWLGLTQKGLIKAFPEQNRYERFNLIDSAASAYPAAMRNVYNTVYAIVEEKGGPLWLATHDGLYRFGRNSGRMEALRDASLQKGAARFDLFRDVFFERDTLWLAAWEGGLSRYAIRSNQWKTWLPSAQQKNGLQSNILINLKPKSLSEFWITATDRGLGTFNRRTERFTFFSNNASYPAVPGGNWNAFVLDHQQGIWALKDEGLVKVEAPEQKFFFRPFRMPGMPALMYVSDRWENDSLELTATLYAGGLYGFNKKSGRRFVLPVEQLSKAEGPEVRQLYRDRGGKLWVLTKDRLYSYDFAANRLVKEPQPTADGTNSFSQMLEDKVGRLWIATRRNGLLLFDPRSRQYTQYSRDSAGLHSLPGYSVLALAMDAKGRVWACSQYGPLVWADPQTGALHPVEVEGLRGTQSFSLFAGSDGNIWAGTYHGLCLFDCSGEKPVLKKILKAADGLHSNLVTAMEEDAAGNLWCLTEATLCRVRKGDFFVSSFDAADDMNWQSPVPHLKRKTGSDSLELLCLNGWYSFAPSSLYPKQAEAPLMITAMRVNDAPYAFEEALRQKGRVVLSPSQDVFSFEFAVLDFSKPATYSYAYKLDGYDRDWIQSGERRFASYTNLPGGDYRFQVRTANGQHLEIPLFIQTPFTKTPLFYFLIFSFTGLLIFFFARSRVVHLRQVYALHAKTETLQKEKAVVMYDALKQQLNPHFLFNSLSSLSSLIEKDGKLANRFLAQLSNVYRYILSNRDKELVPLGEELKFVSSYMELQKTRFKEGLKVHLDVEDQYCSGKVVPVVLQNLAENAIKHNCTSCESPLVITITCQDDYLMVQNNLQKKAFVETSNKQGLLNLKTLYGYYTTAPVLIEETAGTFTVKIPLL